MGTSKSMPTPQGGRWTDVKTDIRACLAGDSDVTPQHILASTITAAGGIDLSSGHGMVQRSSGHSEGAGVSGVASSGRISRGGSLSKTFSGLAGFGNGLLSGNLYQSLNSLGIEDLRGKTAAEVIGKIADHLSADHDGLERDVIRSALQDAIYNAAELEGDPTYENLEQSLQDFLTRNGIEGLVELFLTQYVFSCVWLLVEDYVNKRTDSQNEINNLSTAIEQACFSNVHEEIENQKRLNRFNNISWFGPEGIRVAQTIVTDLDLRLRAAAQGGAQ